MLVDGSTFIEMRTVSGNIKLGIHGMIEDGLMMSSLTYFARVRKDLNLK